MAVTKELVESFKAHVECCKNNGHPVKELSFSVYPVDGEEVEITEAPAHLIYADDQMDQDFWAIDFYGFPELEHEWFMSIAGASDNCWEPSCDACLGQ